MYLQKSLFLSVSSCLSRACLRKLIVLCKNGSKKAVFAPLAERVLKLLHAAHPRRPVLHVA